ncbi:hypothetical protein [Achromobacter xylosoxidans]|uniref:Uncharacterized protein n=1 Tax=Alcaligenes xylosoxydans xylosoxydans TaxID=85698 RepID=A0A424W5F3_ALCXX|nr:hypothetical protein [Achromobacter xylosoxidans]MBC9904789.1 hypothetical protein [Achromobacter xylosoxidans]MBD0868706.1 hypothetical protein [Achromobacter xylosoxidans]QNP87791.1 hypothetical protein IAG39_09895 [Achromobacter xylosoxidans]RPJ88434.1 hypothetical protein DY367_27900 [Achromobacter xylosoxidans]
MLDLEAVFEKFDDEYIRFERIENPAHSRPDVCAFIMLDRLVPGGKRDMVCSAEHDEIWLDIDLDKLAAVASEEDILALVRCGVRLDNDISSLAMFV